MGGGGRGYVVKSEFEAEGCGGRNGMQDAGPEGKEGSRDGGRGMDRRGYREARREGRAGSSIGEGDGYTQHAEEGEGELRE